MPGKRTALAICLLLIAVVARAGNAPLAANGPEPRDGNVTWSLEETWRAGGEDDEVFFGLISRVCAGPRGNIHVLDSQLSTVHVYSPGGEHLRTLFREGDGPGEIRRGRDLTVFPDGRVGVLREMPAAIVTVDSEGVPVGGVQLRGPDPASGGVFSADACFLGGGNLVVSGTEHLRGRPGTALRMNFLSRFDADGGEMIRYTELENIYDFSDLVFDESVHIPGFWWNTAVDADGRVYTAPDLSRYAIDVYSPDGVLERRITREIGLHTRSAAEKEIVRRMIDSALSNGGVPYSIKVMEQDPVLEYIMRGLRFGPDGNLWALPWSGVADQPEGVLATFDVFDSGGAFVRRVSLACPGNGEIDGIFSVGGDRFVVVKGYAEAVAAQFGSGSRASDDEGEEALMEVVCYRVAARN